MNEAINNHLSLENTLALVENNSAIGFALLNKKFNFIFVNTYFANLLKKEIQEILNTSFVSIVSSSDRHLVQNRLSELQENEVQSTQFDVKLLTSDNILLWHNITITYDELSHSYFIVIQNIQIKKEKEIQLSQNEQTFRTIAENSTDQIMRYDLDLKHIYINPATLKLLNIKEEDILGKTHKETRLFDDQMCEFWENCLKEAIKTKSDMQVQFALQTKDKELVIDWAIIPEFDKEKNLISLLGISRDISHKQHLEKELEKKIDELAETNDKIIALNEEYATTNEELSDSYNQISTLYKEIEESEDKYRNAFHTSPDSITITTLNGVYVDINEGFEKISGYKREEVINKSALEIDIWLNKNDRNYIINELKEKGCIYNYECIFKSKTNKPINTIVSASLLKLKEITHILLIARDISEWKKTQFENQQFAEIVSTMQTGIYIYHLEDITNDRTLKLVNINAASTANLGIEKETIINKYIDEVFPNLREQNIPAQFVNVILTGIPLDTTEIQYKDNRVSHSFFSFKAIPLANNHICVLFENISTQKIAEAAYKESQNKYKKIFNSTNEAIFITTEDEFQITEANEAVLKLFDYHNTNEIIKKPLYELTSNLAPYTKEKINEYLQKASFDDTQFIEWIAKKNDGSPFWVEISIRKTLIEDKNRIIAVVRDINQRKKAEEALRDSEMRFNMAFRNSPISLVISTLSNGIYIDVNNTFLREMGYSRNEIIGKSIQEISIYVDKNDRNKLLEKLKQEGIVYGEECLFKTKTGAIKTCLISIGIISIQGEWCLLSTIIDISSRKIMEQDLVNAKNKAEESDRLKSAFLANMSHEIRTPMNAIKGFAQLLERTDMQEAKKYKFTQIISQRTDDLLTLINDLLDIAKIEAGQLTLVEQRDNVNNLFNEIFQFFKAQQAVSEPKPVELIFKNELSWTQNYICTDFFRLRQILINLINNALKFTDEGTVLFGCKINDEGNLLFYVKDSGMGIPEEKYNLIFEPFRQVNDAYLSKKKGGTGLGLSIVKGLVELMNGKVWFESIYGSGTTFYFTLPFIQTPVFQQKKEIEPEREYSWVDKNILIVEDDEANTLLIKELLINTKANCFYATNAKQALSILYEHNNIDLVLMDIQLPDINGYELSMQFKTIKPELIIIAQTAYASEFDKQKALQIGCAGFIAKPIDQYKLLLIIQMCFDGEFASAIEF